ncbi:MAG: carbohydrate binding family 9 domain-containing protein [Gemmatimonadetes bacterium]|nr:carbohydrate binding family 9 domain-containing protein [Gemmatimonadota bacterium]MYK65229.1 carbohydrate binding family 9 domain-containing protein [Gemmatimonadota bacterium]
MTRTAAILVAFHAAAAASAGAQTSSPPDSTLTHRGGYTPPTVTAALADVAPTLDGRLDDPVWQIAMPVTGFRRDRPGDGNPAGERTEVRVAYTGDALYIGARMYAEDPGTISQLRGRRDSFMQANDQFQVQIDSYHDHRTAFVFGVTPAGGRNDLVAPNDGFQGIDSGWDPVWSAATRVDSLGWVAEMRIPFSQLRFGEGEEQVWGINFRRDIFHLGEGVTWSWRPPTEPGWTSQFGHLLGLEGVSRPGRLEVLPYAVTNSSYDQRADPASPFNDGSVTSGNAGVDLKYGLTNGLTLDATFNPDFGQVEADPAVVNLSAYETYFEERRPFFVEGSGLFGFGGMRGLGFFYSRRVGQRPALSAFGRGAYVDQPRASTILGAAKITGRTESDLIVAFMNATTQREMGRFTDGVDMPIGETPVDPLSNITALRIRKDMREGNTLIGAIATGVVRRLDDEVFTGLRDRAFAGGVDFLHRFHNRTYSLSGWAAGSYVRGDALSMLRAQVSPVRYYQRPDQNYVSLDPERTSMTGFAGQLAFRKIAGEWTYGFEGSTVSPGFETNDAGFQTIGDFFSISGGGGRRWTQPGRIFRGASFNLYASESRNFGNQIVDRGLYLEANGQTNGFRSFRLRSNFRFRSLDTRSTRGGPSMHSPANWNANLNLSGDGRNRISGNLNVNYSGDEEGAYGVTLSPSIRGRGDGSLSWSIGPRASRSWTPFFYVAQVPDPLAGRTWSRRYLFAELERTSLSATIRVDLAVTPLITLQVYAEPFLSSGDYEGFSALETPGRYDFLRFGERGSTILQHEDFYSVDADGLGPARTIHFPNPDFRVRSFRSNVVLRWEYLPGSTLFVVWTQDRFGRASEPGLDGIDDVRDLWNDPMRNVLLVKASYWLDF